MQVWAKCKVTRVSDHQTDVNGAKSDARKVTLCGDPGDRPGFASALNVEVAIDNSSDSMISQVFDGQVGEEVYVQITSGSMVKEIDDNWERIEKAAQAVASGN